MSDQRAQLKLSVTFYDIHIYAHERVELIPFSLFPAFKLNCKKMNENENERSKAKKRKYEKYSTVKIESVKRVCFVASYFILFYIIIGMIL